MKHSLYSLVHNRQVTTMFFFWNVSTGIAKVMGLEPEYFQAKLKYLRRSQSFQHSSHKLYELFNIFIIVNVFMASDFCHQSLKATAVVLMMWLENDGVPFWSQVSWKVITDWLEITFSHHLVTVIHTKWQHLWHAGFVAKYQTSLTLNNENYTTRNCHCKKSYTLGDFSISCCKVYLALASVTSTVHVITHL